MTRCWWSTRSSGWAAATPTRASATTSPGSLTSFFSSHLRATSEERPERPQDHLGEPPVQVARLPLAAGELDRVRLVDRPDLFERLGEPVVDDLDVDLIVALEAQPVDVRGPDRRPRAVHRR